MIVELFGPPAVGKTRFVHVLEELARSRGLVLAAVVSDRPAERGAGGHLPAVLARLGTHGAALVAPGRAAGEASPHAALLHLFPPRSALWTIRLRTYIRHLDAAMREGAAWDGVLVIDQGFVQALGSLLVLARHRDVGGLEAALAIRPRADLLVRLDAPPALLRQRYRERLGRMSWTERWLELGLDDTLAFAPWLDHVQALLEAQGSRVIAVDSTTPETVLAGATQVLAAIAAWGRDASPPHACASGEVAA